jgi:hypothetical protein
VVRPIAADAAKAVPGVRGELTGRTLANLHVALGRGAAVNPGRGVALQLCGKGVSMLAAGADQEGQADRYGVGRSSMAGAPVSDGGEAVASSHELAQPMVKAAVIAAGPREEPSGDAVKEGIVSAPEWRCE